jgi:hypothetical protein
MSICASGASHQKPGTTDDIYLTSAIAALVAARYAPWLEPFIGYVAAEQALHLPTFCTVDPPADPGVNAGDLLQLLALGPGPLTQTATDKVKQLLRRYDWFNYCECTAAPQVAPFPPVAAPPGIPSINPAPYVPQAQALGTPCKTVQNTQDVVSQTIDFTVGAYWNPAGPPINADAVPAQWVRITTDVQMFTPPGYFYRMYIEWSEEKSPPAGNLPPSNYWSINGQTQTHVVQWARVPFGVQSYTIWTDSTPGGAGAQQLHFTHDVFCEGQPATTPTNPAAPSALDVGLLTQILQTVTLMQRQDVPFGYVHGAVHAGLVDSGSMPVQGLIGAEVLVTTLPPWLGQITGVPVEHFDVGFVTFGTADGYERSERIDHIPKLVFPESAGVYTSIGYTLAAGVVATITELVREP